MRNVILLFLLMSLVVVSSVFAVQVTLNLTADQVEIGRWKWSQEDPTQTEYPNATAFLQAKVDGMITEWEGQRVAWRTGKKSNYFCSTVWTGYTQPQKDAFCTGAGELTGCNPCQ